MQTNHETECCPDSGAPRFERNGEAFTFGNDAVALAWRVAEARAGAFVLIDRVHGRTLSLTEPFALAMSDGATFGVTNLDLLDTFREETLTADAGSCRLEGRKAGLRVSASFSDRQRRLRVTWYVEQRGSDAWLHMGLEIAAVDRDEPIAAIFMLQVEAHHARGCGDYPGMPGRVDDVYLGIESPLAQAEADAAGLRFSLRRRLPLEHDKRVVVSAVAGVARPGELRRDFARYLEATRARPYAPFLHYNSWYDIGYLTPYSQADALDRIVAIGRELHERRDVQLDSFVFDDGWDDLGGDWRFSPAFPQGFVPLREAAARYRAAPGIWLSPWGGYGAPRAARVANGRKRGYEVVDGGFALSGPHYYRRFREVVMDLLREQGVNHFKFDGTGNADRVVPGGRFDSDWDAAIHLISEIRAERPAAFVNLSTGTLPSPFWLRHVDSIWRGGADDGEAGAGSPRERWITYRDAQTWRNVVRGSPLFPLNSLMLHGIIFAQMHTRLNVRHGAAFQHEVRSYFASGTQLQELYVTPALLSGEDWDAVAQAARWTRTQAGVLVDSHWIGGVPEELDVYGWAAWAAPAGIIALRNPRDRAQTFVLDLRRDLELPGLAAGRFAVRDVWGGSSANVPAWIDAGREHPLKLAPFEVRVLELQGPSQLG
ncbi:enterotoxin [Paraburkholderia adhaesiva]|uniref:enterotoxin n=1 Tax=Paraburkholderia adhaesiva TaxID=2883244 RepID=UPI001F2B7DDD|nr:enterotoxin [Paraburkholderia adhaesiva]